MNNIEWLMEKLIINGSGAVKTFPELFEQAKLLHKQEIIDESCIQIEEFINWIDEKELPREDNKWIMYYNGKDNYLSTRELFEKYYNETYNRENP
jgi:hypothetical protein